MTPKILTRRDLLFHPAHGVCRLDRVTKRRGPGGPVLCYSLVPKMMSKMKVRFVISAPDLEASGFHKVISVKEAKQILSYLKAGDSGIEQTDQTWILARNILCFSKDETHTRDQRRRQRLEHSIRGLVGEFACVLKMSFEEAAKKIQKNLGPAARTSPLILAAFAHAVEN